MTFEDDAFYFMIKSLLIVIGTMGMMTSCTKIKYSAKKTVQVLGLYLLWVAGWSWCMVEFFGVLMLIRLCIPAISLPAMAALYFLSEYSPWQAVFNYAMQISISLILCITQTVVLTMLGGGKIMDFLIRLFSFSVFVAAEWKFLRKRFALLGYLPDKSWRSLTLVPVSFMLLIVLIGTYPVHFIESRQSIIYLYAIAVIMVIVYITLFRNLFHQYKLQLMELTEINNHMLKRELVLMQKQVDDTKRFRHDLRHHNRIAAEYARKGEIDKLLECLEQSEKEYSEDDSVKICENITVNNILEIYAREARQEGIQINISAVVGTETGIRDTDFIAILGNAMENAVHGCGQSKKETCRILVHIRQKSGKVAIRISNTCSPEVEFKKGIPVRKNGKGIGMESIMRSVKCYDGEADFKVENEEFIARILLKQPKEL